MIAQLKKDHADALNGLDRLAPRLSFRLAVLQRQLDRQMVRILGPFGLTLAEYRILITIDAFGELSGADLVRLVAVDKALVSRGCAAMVVQGVLVRRADPNHGRRQLLRLGEPGRALLARIEPLVAERNAGLDGLFDVGERQLFDELIDRLERHVVSDLTEE